MKPIRVVLVEDHHLVRAGLRLLLEKIEEVEIVAEAGDGREALRLIAEHQPDVVMADISMPGMNGLETTAQVTREFPHVRVIILSMHATEVYVLQAVRAGAAGYLLKDATLEELEQAMRSVVQGNIYLTPSISRHVVADINRRFHRDDEAAEQLTPRQREILQLIAEGRTVQEISQILFVTPKTVESHRAQVMERLGIHDIAGLVRYAIRTGLVSPDD